MNTPVINLLQEKGNTVYYTTPDTSVRDAVRYMNEHHIGSLLVTEEGQPVGMFTERDVLVRIVAAGLNPNQTCVGSVMSTRLTLIHPETTVEEAMAIIASEHHRHLPVVDGNGSVVGMISIRDLTRWTVRDEESYIQNLSDYIWGSRSP